MKDYKYHVRRTETKEVIESCYTENEANELIEEFNENDLCYWYEFFCVGEEPSTLDYEIYDIEKGEVI